MMTQLRLINICFGTNIDEYAKMMVKVISASKVPHRTAADYTYSE